jgi:hypothetical protein
MTFDPKCYDLASLFLEDESGTNEKHCNDLAATIQGAIESWIEEYRARSEPIDPPGFEGGFAENH